MRQPAKAPGVVPPWMVPFVAGCCGGIGDTIFNYPPYCLHYRFQRYENLRNLHIYKPRELYRGVGPYAAIIPITCICDGITDNLVERGIPKFPATLGAGALSAIIISAPVGNAIVVNLRLKEAATRVGGKTSTGSLAAIRHIYKTYGLGGFYAGAKSLVLRESIYSSATFYGKDAIQEKLQCGDFVASAISGTIATIFSQPCDTSATRAQNKVVRNPWSTTVMEMWHEDGLRTFYRGFFFRWYAVIAGIYVMNEISGRVKRKLNPQDL